AQNRSLSDVSARLTELGGQEVSDVLLGVNPRRLLDDQPPEQAPPAEHVRRSRLGRLFRD
ncbi:MAG: hypothetical protein ACRDFS_06970, partial [Chloroflexota bacterium]